MSTPFSLNWLRRLPTFRDQLEQSKQLAMEICQQCFDKLTKKLPLNCESLPPVQFRGYLRAVALPQIDLALEEMSPPCRTDVFLARVRTISLDLLEQLLIERLKEQAVALVAEKTAA